MNSGPSESGGGVVKRTKLEEQMLPMKFSSSHSANVVIAGPRDEDQDLNTHLPPEEIKVEDDLPQSKLIPQECAKGKSVHFSPMSYYDDHDYENF